MDTIKIAGAIALRSGAL